MIPRRSLARSVSRRRLIGGGAAGAVGLTVLSLSTPGLIGSARRTASAQTAPWAGGEIPAAARSSRQMAVAARAFLNSLSADQLGGVWNPDPSSAVRTQWSNFPAGDNPRPGVALGDLSDPQRVLLHDLLRASTSTQGYHKAAGAIRADGILFEQQEGRNPVYGSAHYYTSVFGAPEDANWAWMLTGHHMTVQFTVASDRTAFTPMFTGTQPLQIPTGLEAGWQVLPQDASRAAELFASLSADQQGAAIIGTSDPRDVIAGPGRQANLSTFQGVPAGQMDAAQQRLLWLLVREFVANADFDAAEAQLALIQQSWSDTHFAWMGPPPDPSATYYFRVHGPRILIEYDVQAPLTNQGGHIHAITRDPANDYGMDWLGQHYQESLPLFRGVPVGPDGLPSPGSFGPGGPGGPGSGGPPIP